MLAETLNSISLGMERSLLGSFDPNCRPLMTRLVRAWMRNWSWKVDLAVGEVHEATGISGGGHYTFGGFL